MRGVGDGGDGIREAQWDTGNCSHFRSVLCDPKELAECEEREKSENIEVFSQCSEHWCYTWWCFLLNLRFLSSTVKHACYLRRWQILFTSRKLKKKIKKQLFFHIPSNTGKPQLKRAAFPEKADEPAGSFLVLPSMPPVHGERRKCSKAWVPTKMGFGCSESVLANPNFARSERWGVVLKYGCAVPLFRASVCVCACVCVCTVNTLQCLKCVVDREKGCTQKWTEDIYIYISQMLFYQMTHLFTLMRSHCFTTMQSSSFSPSLPPLRAPPPSQIFLCTRPQSPAPGSRWACYSDSSPKCKSSREKLPPPLSF